METLLSRQISMPMRKLALIALLWCCSVPSIASVVVNEFSNGPSGSQEYFELAVVGNPGELVDIRGWIVDDHSGSFSCGSSNGIASGHLRFAIHSNWACVPAGSLILIYNSSSPNVNISLADDPTDSNNDGVYVLPVTSSPYLEANTSNPSSSSCNQYTGSYSAPTNWQPVGLGNSKDAAGTVDPTNLTGPFHTVGYGFGGSSSNVLFSGNGGGQNYSFTNGTSNDWNLQANWTKSTASTGDTPGASNNPANAAWLNSMKIWTRSVDVTSGCAPLTVQFTNSIGTAAGWTHSWDYDDGNTGNTAEPSHTFTSNGTYDVIYNGTSPGGCVIADTFTIQVQTGGTITPPTLSDVCLNQGIVALPAGTPAGTWSGTGVSGNNFDPIVAGLGTTTLTFTVTGPCGGSGTEDITVIANPAVSITASSSSTCENGSAITLQGTPTGGVFTGMGVSGSSFDPVAAGAGNHWVYYESTSSCGTSKDSVSISVNPLPTASLIISSTAFCAGDPNVVLQGTPVGGTFSGTGVSGVIFSPTTAGIGTHELYYTRTNSCGSTTDTVSVVVTSNPQATITATTTNLCANGSSIPLQGTPSGGAFSGTGVVGSSFDPTVSGVGTFWAYYTNTSSCGTAIDSIQFTVNSVPTAAITASSTNVCDNGSAVTLQGSPSGGIFSGTGVTGNSFDPSAGAGSYWVYYTNTITCGTAVDSVNITVTAVPQASLTSSAVSVCEDVTSVTLQGMPAGGVYSGSGVTGSNFDPSQVGAGSYWSYYTNTNFCGTAVDSVSITVLPLAQSTISAASTNACTNGGLVALQGSPAGGVFSGNGVVGTDFDPTSGTLGINWIYYSNTNSCGTVTDSVAITVIAPPTASLTVSVDSVCENATSIQLQGTPVGGVYSGNGIVGSQFVPQNTTVGHHWVYYTNTNSCGVAADSLEMEVLPVPQASIISPVTQACEDAGLIQLQGIPSGGTFSGNGVTGDSFDPASANLGQNWFYYNTQNSCGTATDSVQVEVIEILQANLGATSIQLCENDASITLQGTPIGGVYSGSGINGSSFNPSITGEGQYWITYSVQNSCSFSEDSIEIIVLPLPEATITSTVGQLCTNGVPVTLTGDPLNGTFSGVGVSGDRLYPNQMDTGISWIYYSVQNSCGIKEDSMVISVTGTPEVTVGDTNFLLCNGEEKSISPDGWLGALLWSTGETSDSIIVSDAGQYTVTVTNQCGSVAASFTIETASAVADFTAEPYEFQGGQFTAVNDSMASYEWLIDGLFETDRTTFTYEFGESGEFLIELSTISPEGCEATEEQYFVIEPQGGLFVPTAFTPNGDGLNDEFRIVGEMPDRFYARVFDRWGNMVAEWFNINYAWDGKHDGKTCASGVYVLQYEYLGKITIQELTILESR